MFFQSQLFDIELAYSKCEKEKVGKLCGSLMSLIVVSKGFKKYRIMRQIVEDLTLKGESMIMTTLNLISKDLQAFCKEFLLECENIDEISFKMHLMLLCYDGAS